MTINHKTINPVLITPRARRCWGLMDKNEHAIIRFGMTPSWCSEIDLGGKTVGENWLALEGDEHRIEAIALMLIAKENGGMVM